MFDVGIHLPFASKDHNWFVSYANKSLTKNKTFEWQTGYFGWPIVFEFRLELFPFGRDHAEVGIEVFLFGFMVSAMVADNRHWNHETNTWEEYPRIPPVA